MWYWMVFFFWWKVIRYSKNKEQQFQWSIWGLRLSCMHGYTIWAYYEFCMMDGNTAWSLITFWTCCGWVQSKCIQQETVPDSSFFRSKQMVDPVSTRALQGCPRATQSRYSPLASPQHPTIGQSWWRGDKEQGEGPLTASLRSHFPAVTLSGAGGSEQGSPWQSAPILRS